MILNIETINDFKNELKSEKGNLILESNTFEIKDIQFNPYKDSTHKDVISCLNLDIKKLPEDCNIGLNHKAVEHGGKTYIFGKAYLTNKEGKTIQRYGS